MRPWVLELAIDKGMYLVDLRKRSYRYLGSNPAWRKLAPEESARNKRQLHGLTRMLRDGSTKVFLDPTWPYTEEDACPTCYSWIPRDSPCDHAKYECPTCGRRQCLMHWRYPMKTRREAVHFLKSAQVETGKKAFVRQVEEPRDGGPATVWKIFTSEEDYAAFLRTGKHRR